MVFDVSLEMQSDSKTYVGVQDDEITEPVHTVKSSYIGMCLTLRKFTLTWAVRGI